MPVQRPVLTPLESGLARRGAALTAHSNQGKSRGAPPDWGRLSSGQGVHLDAAERQQRQQAAAIRTIRQMIKGNRQLFGEKISDVAGLFRAIDADGGGTIERGEFGAALARLGLGLSTAQLSELWSGLDADGNGVIDYDELLAELAPTRRPQSIQSAGKWRGSEPQQQSTADSRRGQDAGQAEGKQQEIADLRRKITQLEAEASERWGRPIEGAEEAVAQPARQPRTRRRRRRKQRSRARSPVTAAPDPRGATTSAANISAAVQQGQPGAWMPRHRWFQDLGNQLAEAGLTEPDRLRLMQQYVERDTVRGKEQSWHLPQPLSRQNPPLILRRASIKAPLTECLHAELEGSAAN